MFAELTANDFKLIVDDELYLSTLVYLTEACIEFDFWLPGTKRTRNRHARRQ